MPDRAERLAGQIHARCAVIAELVRRMHSVYHSTALTDYQRQHIETIVGAGLWHIPNSGLWTGRVSRALLTTHHPSTGDQRPKLTQDHHFPRKAAARELLNTDWSKVENPVDYVNRRNRDVYGRFNYVTPRENRTLMPYQKADRFTTPEQAYMNAGVELVEVSPEQLLRVRARDEETIRDLLDASS